MQHMLVVILALKGLGKEGLESEISLDSVRNYRPAWSALARQHELRESKIFDLTYSCISGILKAGCWCVHIHQHAYTCIHNHAYTM